MTALHAWLEKTSVIKQSRLRASDAGACGTAGHTSVLVWNTGCERPTSRFWREAAAVRFERRMYLRVRATSHISISCQQHERGGACVVSHSCASSCDTARLRHRRGVLVNLFYTCYMHTVTRDRCAVPEWGLGGPGHIGWGILRAYSHARMLDVACTPHARTHSPAPRLRDGDHAPLSSLRVRQRSHATHRTRFGVRLTLARPAPC